MRLALLLLCGCSSQPISRLYGEVHIHGFPGGVHPAALFVTPPLPAKDASGESIFGADGPPLGSCAPSGSDTSALPTIQSVDAGAIAITGGSGIPRVDLRFDATVRAYLPTAPLPHDTELFAGGDELHVHAAGAADPGFSGELRAPERMSLVSPSSLGDVDGDLEVRWAPSGATRISLVLVGSTTSGDWSAIACNADDPDGGIVIPAALIATLPPPPRDLQLQVSRDVIVRVAGARDGDGVVLHAAHQATLDGHQL